MKNKIHCIITKLVSIATLIVSILFTPFQYYYCGLDFTWSNLIILLLISSMFFSFGWFQFLKTNNPLSRYNPFSLHPRWKTRMDYSMEENPGQLYQLDKPTEEEILQSSREKKLNQLLK